MLITAFIVLIGTKCDLEAARKITFEEEHELAEHLQLPFFEMRYSLTFF